MNFYSDLEAALLALPEPALAEGTTFDHHTQRACSVGALFWKYSRSKAWGRAEIEEGEAWLRDDEEREQAFTQIEDGIIKMASST